MKMKALRWYGIHDVRAEEIDKPVPAAEEVLVRVLYAGICGSDLHIYNKGMFIQNVPETMGHEFCGVVEEALKRRLRRETVDRKSHGPLRQLRELPVRQF